MKFDPVTSDQKLKCHVHPRYKAIRKPRPGCVLCHAIWQEKLVADEQIRKLMRFPR